MRNVIGSAVGTLMLATLAIGCGGGGSDVNNFVGTWMYTSGTFTTTCPGQAADTQQLMGNETLSKGATSDLLLAGGPCTLKLSVKGGNADAVPGQMCSSTDQSGTIMLSVTGYSFVTTDGKNAHESGNGNASVNNGSSTLTCMFSLTGDF